MKSPKQPALDRKFTKDEKASLVDYLTLKSPSKPEPTIFCDDPEFEAKYRGWISEFIDQTNRDGRQESLARMAMRKAWTADTLPRSMMESLCLYIVFYINSIKRARQEEHYCSLVSTSQKQLLKTIQQLSELDSCLQDEDVYAHKTFHIPSINKEISNISDLAMACLKSGGEIKTQAQSSFTPQRRHEAKSVLQKFALCLGLDDPQQAHRRISLADISKLLCVLHTSMSKGIAPDQRALDHYSESTLIKEAGRLGEMENLEKLLRVDYGMTAIAPDLGNGTEQERSGIPKVMPPRKMELSKMCQNILFLSDMWKHTNANKVIL